MAELVPGEILDGKYRVLRPIGEGGMGTVYEGEHVRIARRVAIKVMHAAMASERDLVERFEREAQAAARIGSSYVVDVLDLGDLPSGERYMVMEFLDGESLAARLSATGPLAPSEVGALALQLLDGLAKVHDAGIIHRDLKPGNIFLAKAEDGSDFVKLLDFGICKFTQRMSIEPAGSGRLLGTLGYMSPELMIGRAADSRSDIYSVGVVLFRCVAGTMPYTAKNPVDLLVQIQGGARRSLRDLVRGVDEAFAAIVERAMHPRPESRFADAREMREALARWASRLGRIDRLLADFLEVDVHDVGYLERRRSQVPPPRTRGSRDATETPTVDLALKQSAIEAMTQRLRSGLHPIYADPRAEPEDEAQPTRELRTRKLPRYTAEVPIRRPLPREESEEPAPRDASAGGLSRANRFSRREPPTRPKTPKR